MALLRLVNPAGFGFYECDFERAVNPVSACGGSVLLFGDACPNRTAAVNQRCVGNMCKTCRGAPSGLWPAGRLFANHLPVTSPELLPRMYGMFRHPKSRALSSFYYFGYNFGRRGASRRGIDGAAAAQTSGATPGLPPAVDPRVYAHRVRGVVSRMLAGTQRGIVCSLPTVATGIECTRKMTEYNAKRVAVAKRRLQQMRFVGLQGHWKLSMCLLHAMTRTACQVSELGNDRRTVLPSSLDSNAIRAAIYNVTDREDEELYEAASSRFWQDVARFNLSDEVCKRRCAAGRGAGLIVRGAGHMGLDQQGYPSHYSHLLRNWLPRLWECQEAFPGVTSLFVPEKLHKLIGPIAARYGMTVTVVKGVECPTRVPTFPPDYYFDMFSNASLKASLPCKSADVVLVHREASHLGRRHMANSNSVRQTVVAFARRHQLTFEAVLFEQYNFTEQQRKVCSTRLVVAQHGAGVGNALFSHVRPAVVLELPPGLKTWWSGVLDPRHGFTFIQSYNGHKVQVAERAGNGVANISIPVLIEALEKALTRLQQNAIHARKELVVRPWSRAHGGANGPPQVETWLNVTSGNAPKKGTLDTNLIDTWF